jgi:hypothetical protein
MLGPHLTDENVVAVLARAKHRTKKELARLVRQLDPLPDVPPRIEPFGPAPARLVPEAPSWSEFVRSMAPVRELAPGDRPRDWADAAQSVNDVQTEAGPASKETLPEPQQPVPARLSPERYKVQFTASEEYVKLVEQAQALLSHSAPGVSLDDLHLRAMRALVTELERKKYAVTPRPRSRPSDEREHANEHASPRQRGRHVPAAVRRAVFERDEGCCTYADASGQRCRETHGLELHHSKPFARGGGHTEHNLTLRCRAHNALAAEDDFGRDFIAVERDSTEHESWASGAKGR